MVAWPSGWNGTKWIDLFCCRLSDFADDPPNSMPGLGMSPRNCLDVDIKNEPISPPPPPPPSQAASAMSAVRCHSQQQQQQSSQIPSQQLLSLNDIQRPHIGQALRSVVSERQFLSVPSATVSLQYQACQSQLLGVADDGCFRSASGGGGNVGHDSLFDACSAGGDFCFQPTTMKSMHFSPDHRFNPVRSGVNATRDQCYPSAQSGLAPRSRLYEAAQNQVVSPPGSGQFLSAHHHGSLSPSESVVHHQFHLGQTGISSREGLFQMGRPQNATDDRSSILDSSLYQCHRNFDGLYATKRPRLTADDWLS